MQQQAIYPTQQLDMWKCANLKYFCAWNISFIDTNWTMNQVMIQMSEFEDAHTGVNIAAASVAAKTEWLGEINLVAEVTDGAANALKSMEDYCRYVLISNKFMSYIHSMTGENIIKIRCFCHLLNLLLLKVLKVIDKEIGVIRKFVTKTRQSEPLHKAFLECCASVQIQKELKKDCETRWYSVIDMIDRYGIYFFICWG